MVQVEMFLKMCCEIRQYIQKIRGKIVNKDEIFTFN